ncbi:MAG: dCTP deaminase [Nostoc sp.]|uniref:dCTP deaminase n=1 Tax=Nostoc sp. TaxID=1180 RepID=UPI002FFB8803
MRLSSTDIRRFLEEGSLKIVGKSELEFNANEQIRPSSVDVRISDDFWKFKNYETLEYLDILDIEKARYFKDNPKLIYEQIHLLNGEYLEIKPGELIITETFEWIELPTFLSANLKGRSSFARLGISIHCTGDFINPGYKGHMPMQLVNHSSIPIRIYPYLSMAQLVFERVSSEPDVDYQNLSTSIYKSDSGNVGGLSLWFRDREIEKVALRISGAKFEQKTQMMIEDALIRSEKRTLKQIESSLKRAKVSEPKQIEKRLQNFESKDIKRDKKMRIFFWIFTLLFGADLSVFIPELIKFIITGNIHEPMFWISFIIGLFSLIILWITFDIKFIGF